MEFKYSTTWNSNTPLHGIQVFHYMEFKYSTTWNLNWLNGFENSTTWNLWFHLLQIWNLQRIWQTQYQVLEFYLFFIHTVGSISKYEIEIMVSYSITHMPFLCSIAVWLFSDQYRFCLSQISREEWTEKQRGKSTVTSKIFKNFISKQTLCR